MTNKQILEYNTLCAEFLGYVNTTPTDPDFNIYENEKGFSIGNRIYPILETMSMQFHSDWNWIMEVVKAMEHRGGTTIMNRYIRGSFEIDSYGVKFNFSPNNEFLLQLELKPFINEYTFKHPMFKYHIIEEFDFKNKTKMEAVVQAIYLFLKWYKEQKL
jgi:hypothetical protein